MLNFLPLERREEEEEVEEEGLDLDLGAAEGDGRDTSRSRPLRSLRDVRPVRGEEVCCLRLLLWVSRLLR